MGGRVVQVNDAEAARHAHGPLHILPAPAGEARVEGLGLEHVAADQQVGGVDVFLRLLRPLGIGHAFGLGGHGPVDLEFRVGRGLQQGEAAEGDGRILARDQIGPVAQEAAMVGPHVAIEEQQAAAARRRSQPVASDGAALVGGQGDQPRRQGHGLHLRHQPGGQVGVGGAVVQHDDLDGPVDRGGLLVEQLQQLGRIVAQEGDQHRDRRSGGLARGVVGDLRLGGGGLGGGRRHAATFPARRRATRRRATSRTPAALMVRATAA